MEKIKIHKLSLRLRRNSFVTNRPAEMQMFKLTEAEAFAPGLIEKTFENALSELGKDRLLRIGEVYEGYILCFPLQRAELYWLNGSLVLEKRRICYNQRLDSLIAQERVLRPDGVLFYVWLFEGCTDEMQSSVKKKLTDALYQSAINGCDAVAELTQEEDKNLRSYLGEKYYGQFFSQVP